MNKTSQSISKRKKSTQNLIGIETFSRYGLKTNKSEIAFFMVSPTNISVLSQANIDVKIHHLMALLSTVPELEIVCLDSCECFDENKLNIQKRLREETNENVRKVLNRDLEFLDHIQVEMSTARQFLFCIRTKKEKQEQIFHFINRVQKAISEHGFEIKLMSKSDIKRMLAIYFEASMSGEEISDIEGMEHFNLTKEGMGNV